MYVRESSFLQAVLSPSTKTPYRCSFMNSLPSSTRFLLSAAVLISTQLIAAPNELQVCFASIQAASCK